MTERQQAQQREAQLQADLAHLARVHSLGEMATTLAHELNQPLLAITNYTIKTAPPILRARAADPLLPVLTERPRFGKVLDKLGQLYAEQER